MYMRFNTAIVRPRWEGIIFTGIDLGDPRISISSIEPARQLADYIENVWFMEWDIKSYESMMAIVAPNPCVKLVALQLDNVSYPPTITGTKKEADIFELCGSGATVGIDFKPGGFYALFGKSMSNWPESRKFADSLLHELRGVPDEKWTETSLIKWLTKTHDLLSELLRTPSQNSFKQISVAVEGALKGAFENPEEMAHEAGLSVRSLQRIFKVEVGISPRDLLRIARFNTAIRQIAQDDFKMFAEIALESRFFDQPHMANEFQKLVATQPSKFRRYL